MSEYRDPILQKLIDTLEAEGPSELIGHYKQGDVIAVSKEELPVVTVTKDSTRMGAASNQEDDQLLPIVINVIYDFMRDLTQSSDLEVGMTTLYGYCEGRSEEDYNLLPSSIAYVLRSHPKLDNNLYISVGPNEELSINYGMGVERRGKGIFSVEAVLRFNMRFQQNRPGSS